MNLYILERHSICCCQVGVNQSHSASYLDLMLDNGAELYHEQYDEHGVQIERCGRD